MAPDKCVHRVDNERINRPSGCRGSDMIGPFAWSVGWLFSWLARSSTFWTLPAILQTAAAIASLAFVWVFSKRTLKQSQQTDDLVRDIQSAVRITEAAHRLDYSSTMASLYMEATGAVSAIGVLTQSVASGDDVTIYTLQKANSEMTQVLKKILVVTESKDTDLRRPLIKLMGDFHEVIDAKLHQRTLQQELIERIDVEVKQLMEYLFAGAKELTQSAQQSRELLQAPGRAEGQSNRTQKSKVRFGGWKR